MFTPGKNTERTKVRFGLFLIFLLFMPFYEGTCTHDFAAGYPVALFALEKGDAATVWQPFRSGNPLHQVLGNLGIDFASLLVFGLILALWFRSPLFQQRARLFRFSNIVCFVYIFYCFIVGWVLFINQLLEFEFTAILYLLYRVYAHPMMYLGGPFITPFLPPDRELSALALMPLALTIALFNLYWIAALVSFLWLKSSSLMKR